MRQLIFCHKQKISKMKNIHVLPNQKNFEAWKDVIGYEGLYQVSNFGDVRSLDRIVNKPKKMYNELL